MAQDTVNRLQGQSGPLSEAQKQELAEAQGVLETQKSQGSPAGQPQSPATSGGNTVSGGDTPKVQWVVPEKPHHAKPNRPYDPYRKPSGPPKTLGKKDRDPDNIRACEGENEAAVVLAQYGYDYEQIRETTSSPDGRVTGVSGKWDVYSPRGSTTKEAIHTMATHKVNFQNAPYFVVRLESEGQSIPDLADYFKNHPIPGLKQVFVVQNGKLHIIY